MKLCEDRTKMEDRRLAESVRLDLSSYTPGDAFSMLQTPRHDIVCLRDATAKTLGLL